MVAAVTLLAARIGVPYPILMVVAGLVIGLVPAIPHVELDPEIVLALFLPPILFSARLLPFARDLWRNVRPISLLAVGLVIMTTLAVGAVAMALAPELGWPVAIALGAIVSPPDAIAATVDRPAPQPAASPGHHLRGREPGERRHGPHRLPAGGGGRGGHRLAATRAARPCSFVTVAVGGAVVGLVVGWVATWLLGLLDDPPVEVLVSLLVPFAAYLPAEKSASPASSLWSSPGSCVGYRSPRIMRSDTRLLGASTWKMVIFVVNGLAFLLIGLQLPTVLDDIEGYAAGELVGLAAAVCLTVVLVRLAWVYPATYLPALALPVPGAARPGTAGTGPAHPRAGAACAARSPSPRRSPCPSRPMQASPSQGAASSSSWRSGHPGDAHRPGADPCPLIRRLGVTDDGSIEHEELHARAVVTEAALARLESCGARSPATSRCSTS